MSLPTVEKFLCFLEIEIAGIVLGWLTVAAFILAYISMSAYAIFGWFLGGVIEPDQSLIHQLVIMVSNNWLYFTYLVYCIFMIAAGIELIRGTNNRNHHKMKLFLVFTTLGLFITSIGLTSAIPIIWVSVVVIALVAMIHLYALICVYSLHQKFKHAETYQTL